MVRVGRRERQGAGEPSGGRDLLLLRPAPPRPSVYRGAKVVGDYAVLEWDTAYGAVGLAYSLVSGNGPARWLVDELWGRHDHRGTNRYAAVVVGQSRWGLHAPELEAIDLYDHGRLSDRYEPSWEQVATVLGTRAPWWHSALRDRTSILAWTPDAPPAIVPACEIELPTEALTTLAADEPDGSPAAEVCLWLARRIRHRSAESARSYLDLIDEERDSGCQALVLGAVPAPIRRPAPEPLPEIVRRAGWMQMAERRDSVAAAVARLAQLWDGGGDWPTGAIAELDPNVCPIAAQWATRLVNASADQPPTVLERRLFAQVRAVDTGVLLHDPTTGLPAVRRTDHLGHTHVIAAVPQRIPTTAPLTRVDFSDRVVWIRTDDDGLWIAPEHPGHGLSWGYSGSGPHTLAILLDRLLDDITTQPVDTHTPPPPPGLLYLIENAAQDEPTTYTRADLERARRR